MNTPTLWALWILAAWVAPIIGAYLLWRHDPHLSGSPAPARKFHRRHSREVRSAPRRLGPTGPSVTPHGHAAK
jgi:hypothetical protein